MKLHNKESCAHVGIVEELRHSHDYVMADHHESRTWWVVAITTAMMVVELGHAVLADSTL